MRELYSAGEWEENPTSRPRHDRRWKWKEKVGYFFPEGWTAVATHPALRGEDWRVLAALVSVCDWSNQCTFSSGKFGQRFGIRRQQVARALHRLAAARCLTIERGPERRDLLVTLSPQLVWRGRPHVLHSARAAFDAHWQLLYGSVTGAAMERDAAAAKRADSPRASHPPYGTRRAGAGPSLAHPPPPTHASL